MTAATTTDTKAKRQTFTGTVVSSKMKDTTVIVVSRYVKHAKYHKFMTRRTKIAAHDPGNTKKEGEQATVESCKPVSKRKSFRVIA
ncbi:MAG: 30S ribosomal protein S17 [Patescibacteria group bacterium]|nr:30S ribosomal protein S17 [Patescibacteria group bacterium]